MNTTTEPYILFGSIKPWLPPPWTTTDDRVRGGASQSYLSALSDSRARFHGHLDTSTLGGAGFASQFSPPQATGLDNDDGKERSWDLSGYDGIEVQAGEGDGKVYTLILKDEEATGKREDGREKAGINWEVDFKVGEERAGGWEKEGAGGGVTRIWVPWEEFKATYRGKEKKDAGELKKGEVRRIGLMMRSYFGKQEGDFSVVLRSICARKTPAKEEKKGYTKAVGRLQGSIPQNADTTNEQPGKERRTGWLEFLGESIQLLIASRVLHQTAPHVQSVDRIKIIISASSGPKGKRNAELQPPTASIEELMSRECQNSVRFVDLGGRDGVAIGEYAHCLMYCTRT